MVGRKKTGGTLAHCWWAPAVFFLAHQSSMSSMSGAQVARGHHGLLQETRRHEKEKITCRRFLHSPCCAPGLDSLAVVFFLSHAAVSHKEKKVNRRRV